MLKESLVRRTRRGFTLTEILMAVGILGIGLTMVASVFPVAVDQSRRSRETTMAALCARSTAAILRARRDVVTPTLRPALTGTAPATYKTVEIGVNGGLANRYKVYNPDAFLYDNTPIRSYADNNADPYVTWQLGNYVPVVLATPTGTLGYDGPWRLTIVIYKSRGNVPDNVNFSATGGKYMGPYTVNRGGPGTYLIDCRDINAGNARGEAYLVDSVVTSSTGAASDKIYLAAPVTTNSANTVSVATQSAVSITGAAGLPGWVSMPGAIAVYHTILGE